MQSLSTELGSGNLGSHGEAVNAMLQGLMSFKVELSMGVMREVWQGSELAKICQQCHMSVMGCNTFISSIWGHIFHPSLPLLPSSIVSFKLHLGILTCSGCYSAWLLRITMALGKVPPCVSTVIYYKLSITTVLVCLCVHILLACTLQSIFIVKSGIVVVSPSQIVFKWNLFHTAPCTLKAQVNTKHIY